MPKFRFRGQLLELDVCRNIAKNIVYPHHTLHQRRELILSLKHTHRNQPEEYAYISALVYMYAISRCNVATKPHEPLSLFDLDVLIKLAFEKHEREYAKHTQNCN